MSRPEWPELPEGVQAGDYKLVFSAEVTCEPFLTCFECKHAYKTERELVETFNAIGMQDAADLIVEGWTPVEFEAVDDAAQIFFCPLCSHDL